jgi:DNA-binding Lrp family transcriptional regulator
MDDTDRRLVNALQEGLPLVERPFAEIGKRLGLDADEVVLRVARLRGEGVLSRFGPMFDAERLGGGLSLCAIAVPVERFDEVAALVNAFPQVAHNYARDHALNMWLVLATERAEEIAPTVAAIEAAIGLPVLDLPKLEEYFLKLRLVA